jgi:hypothetical protein
VILHAFPGVRALSRIGARQGFTSKIAAVVHAHVHKLAVQTNFAAEKRTSSNVLGLISQAAGSNWCGPSAEVRRSGVFCARTGPTEQAQINKTSIANPTRIFVKSSAVFYL